MSRRHTLSYDLFGMELEILRPFIVWLGRSNLELGMMAKEFDPHEAEEIPTSVDAHFTGILLQNRIPGLRYTASTPQYRIIATRTNAWERFLVTFMRRSRDGGPSPTAALFAGRDRDSIERCIMSAVDNPSLLTFVKRRKKSVRNKARYKHESPGSAAGSTAPYTPEALLDPTWPPPPGEFDPADKINLKTVADGRIYRLATHHFTVGAWRADATRNFNVSVVRHGESVQRRQEVGDTLESVLDFTLEALRSDYIPFWRKAPKPLSLSPEAWHSAAEPKKRSKSKNDPAMRGPRVVRKGGRFSG